MQTSFMHPPFGFALFYLRSVAPASIKTTDIYWGAVPFVCIQIIMVALIIIFPGMISYGDPAHHTPTQQESEAMDLNSLMQQQEGGSGDSGEDGQNELLKQLQQNNN